MDFILLTIVTCLSVIISLSIHNKLARRYLLLVLAIWIAPMFISMFDPFDLYHVSLNVYLIVILGLLSFVIGYALIPLKIKANKNVVQNRELGITWLLKSKKIRLIYLLSLIVLISLSVTQYSLIALQGGMGNLKLDFFELIFNNNSALYFLYQALLCPIFYIVCMVAGFQIINGVFNTRISLMLVYILCFSYLGGKRGYFATFLEYLLICFVIKKSVATIYKGVKRIPLIKIALLGLVILGGAGYMTMMSKGGDRGLEGLKSSIIENVENAILYNIGPFRSLDYALNNNLIAKDGTYTYGRSTLGGMVDYYGCTLLKMIGISIPQARQISMSPIQENGISIGKNRGWNFSYTSYYYFLYDVSYIGIILFPFLFGFFVRYCINRYIINQTIGMLCLIGYLFIACILFNASWFNISLYAQPTIIWCFILDHYERKYLSNRKK